ncbi:MAG: hypothetical protein PETM_00962 [Petrimonas sp.]|uniref:GLPGLI family protein n=1 Tax=Petrimonas sp. TaxID=2023866 RepID=UPI0030D62D22
MIYQKKLIPVILSILFISINLQSAKVEKKNDKAFLRIVYTFTQKDYTRESLSSRTDTMALDIGPNLSEFYDMTAIAKDSLKYSVFQPAKVKSVTLIKNPHIAESAINSNLNGNNNVFSPNSYISFTIFKDRDENHVYTLDKELRIGGISVFLDEEIYPQQWIIESDTINILNYPCHIASTKFRGREYEVYFTQEIPVNEGPWKLYGLPGLILAAKTTDGIFSFKAIGIQEINDRSLSIPDVRNSEVIKDIKQYNEFIQSKAKTESYIFENKGNITIANKFSSKKIILLETEEN